MLAGAGAQFFDNSGVPLTGGLIYTYAAGTTTPQAAYTTSAGNVAHSNPIVLNSAGRVASGGEIWLTDAVAYKFVLQTSAAVTIATYDNVTGNSSGIYAAFAASSGSSLVGYTQGGTGAVATTVQAKLRQTVSVFDFGAVGDGTTNDTAAVSAAIATGFGVYVPMGYTFAITGNVTGFANNQQIFGGGKFKKLGTTQTPMFLLPDESDNVWFNGLEFDGTSANFSAGNPVPAILGYITKSLKVTNCYFYNIIDAGIKLRDGANLYASGNTFYNVGENGIELHNYALDPRTGLNYTGTRPVIEGNHTIIGNRFEKITRYENPLGPLVDACGIIFVGDTGYPQKNIRIIGNVLIDCLRGIWTENNSPKPPAENIVINGNTMENGVNGGTAQNIYGKYGVGLVGAINAVVTSNTFKNIANTNPVGSETSCITVSNSNSANIEISGNSCVDNSGLADRTEWGIYCLIGTNLRIHNNYVSGVQNSAGIYIHPTDVTSSVVYANINTDSIYSWNQIVPLVFALSNIPANTTSSAYPYNMTAFDDSMIFPTGGRIVAVSARLSTVITAGSLIVKTYGNGVEMTNLQITATDFAGTTNAYKRVGSMTNTLIAAKQPYKVTVVTDASFTPTTDDIVITLFIDIGPK